MAIKRAKVSRKQRVLDAMRDNPNKTITVYYAFNHLGETRLAATIHQLKAAGHEISKETLEGKNKFGDEIHYAKYKLEKEAV
jgi:hypothetical protein